jgi:hypothetical protein
MSFTLSVIDTECRNKFIIVNVFMLRVTMLSVVLLSVVAP